MAIVDRLYVPSNFPVSFNLSTTPKYIHVAKFISLFDLSHIPSFIDQSNFAYIHEIAVIMDIGVYSLLYLNDLSHPSRTPLPFQNPF